MRMRVGLVVAGVLLVAGCGSSGQSADTVAAPASPITTTDAATTVASTPTPALTSAAPAASGAVPLGSEVKLSVAGTALRVTAYTLNTAVTSKQGPPPSGSHYVSIDAKFCLDSTPNNGPVALSWGPWSLADANAGTYQAAQIVYSDFPMPQFPAYDKTPIAPGECARGSIVFPVADGATVTSVKYASKAGATARWSVA